jgi:hypothetical protein
LDWIQKGTQRTLSTPTANPKGDVDGLKVIVAIPGLEPNILSIVSKMPDYLIIGFFLQLQYRPNRFVDILLILQHAWNIMDNQDFRLASTDLPVIWRHLSFMLYII